MHAIVRSTLEDLLGSPSNLEFAIESGNLESSIPLYDRHYPERRELTLQNIEKTYKGKLSLGGWSFAQGVGVPDNVITSLKAALSMF